MLPYSSLKMQIANPAHVLNYKLNPLTYDPRRVNHLAIKDSDICPSHYCLVSVETPGLQEIAPY